MAKFAEVEAASRSWSTRSSSNPAVGFADRRDVEDDLLARVPGDEELDARVEGGPVVLDVLDPLVAEVLGVVPAGRRARAAPSAIFDLSEPPMASSKVWMS